MAPCNGIELVAGVVAGLNSGASADVAICPPFTLLDTVRQAIGESDIALGAQDLALQEMTLRVKSVVKC